MNAGKRDRRTVAVSLALGCALASLLAGCGSPEETATAAEPAWMGRCGHLEIVEIGEIDIAPQLRARADPAIDALPVEGPVLFETILDAEGNVCDVRLRKGLTPELDAAAEQAIRQWKFAPALKDGTPVAVRYMAAVNYEKPGKPQPEE